MEIRLVTMLMPIALLAVPAAATVDPSRAFLMAAFDLSAAEIGRLDRGEVVSRTLDVKNHREIATLGIVHIDTSPSSYVERLADITTFKRTDGVLQIGRFSSIPQLADVASLSLDEPELKRLRECRVEDCDVRLSAEVIERVQREIDWRAADASTPGDPADPATARRLRRSLPPGRDSGGDGVRGSRAATECRP